MKKSLITSVATLAVGLFAFAGTNMIVKLNNGENVKFNVDNVKEVVFEETHAAGNIPDIEETGLQFGVSDTTAVVIKGDYSKLDSVFIPSKVKIDGSVYTVTGIANNAFSNCKNLTYVNVSEGVTNMGIATFSYCENLETVVLGEGIKKISSSLFNGCASLSDINIPASVTEIDGAAFEGCASLASIDIPANVTNIVEYAFFDCQNLASINVDDKNPAYASVDGVLYNKEKTILVQVPGKFQGKFTIPSGVTKIESGAFGLCKGLTGVEIPNTVTSISEFAFEGCTGLTNLTIPSSVKFIDWEAFKGCENLDVVILNAEEDVTVGGDAFDDCKSVTWKIIDESIPDKESTGLQFEVSGTTAMVAKGDYSKLDSVFIPSKVKINGSVYTVTGIVNNAFYNCKSLTYVKVSGGVTNMGVATFSGCENLKTVVLGDGIKKISNSLFYGCASLSDINIPASVTEIDGAAFEGCASLASIDIPANVTNIVEYAFYGCKNLASINVDDNNPAYASVYGVLYNKEKTILIQVPAKIQGKFTILYGITNIASGAFGLCEGLTGVKFQNTVTSISEYAFENCTGLTNLTIPSSVKNIDTKAFSGCKNLDLVISNAKENVTVESGALDDCKSVTWDLLVDESESPLKFKILTDSTAEVTKNCVEGSVTIPSKVVIDGKTYSVVSIAYRAFENCKGLTNITIPKSVIEIDVEAFKNSGLTTIELPSSITSIGYGLFASCSDLVSVKIPSSVESIGESAFVDCTSLTNLELSSSVKTIGVNAFNGCENLDLVIDNSEDNVEVRPQAFKNCKSVTWKK